jgi:hypothetical protein
MTSKHHNPRGPLLDMREYGQRVVALTRGLTEQSILGEPGWVTRAALERALFIIGEAANRVPREVQAQHPQVRSVAAAVPTEGSGADKAAPLLLRKEPTRAFSTRSPGSVCDWKSGPAALRCPHELQ